MVGLEPECFAFPIYVHQVFYCQDNRGPEWTFEGVEEISSTLWKKKMDFLQLGVIMNLKALLQI
jgi:hypothetical protein